MTGEPEGSGARAAAPARRVALVALEDDRRLARLVEARGGEAVVLPLLRVELAPAGSAEAMEAALERLRPGDWVALTSARTLRALAELGGRLGWKGLDEAFRGRALRVAAVGGATARAAEEAGLPVELRGGGGDLELAERLAAAGARRVLLPRSGAAGEGFPQRLRELGVEPLAVTVYENVLAGERLPEAATLLRERRPEAALLTSGSTALALAEALRAARLAPPPVGVIGASTRRAAEEAGLPVAFMAARPSLEELVEALDRFLAGRE
ncbi:MAG: uroporphyrinogen-III synthase [Bacillota bacterium]|nr:uroporphyrinogen-III synthase [Bacillota bacterium]